MQRRLNVESLRIVRRQMKKLRSTREACVKSSCVIVRQLFGHGRQSVIGCERGETLGLAGKRVSDVVDERWSECAEVRKIEGSWTLGGRVFKDMEDLDFGCSGSIAVNRVEMLALTANLITSTGR
jgi:hypothetical protein